MGVDQLRTRIGERECFVEGCTFLFRSHGDVDGEWVPLCDTHYNQAFRTGRLILDPQRRQRKPADVTECVAPGCNNLPKLSIEKDGQVQWACPRHTRTWRQYGNFSGIPRRR